MNKRNRLLVPLFAALALVLFSPIGFAPVAAQAQSAYPMRGPRIDGFDVRPAARLEPGNELVFTLYGSPGGTATVRIAGAQSRFTLEEVERGVYEGSYIIRGRDRIAPRAQVTANLRIGNQIATDMLDEPLLAGMAPPAPVAAAPPPGPRIERFEVEPAQRLDSGYVLFFAVRGEPGAYASVRIAGVGGRVSLSEVAPGRYEGSYTISERDRIAPNAVVTASLRKAERESNAVLGQSLLAAAGRPPSQRPVVRNCPNCGVVEAVNVVEVKGRGGFLGTIAGGVVGAVVGSQVGGGRGTTAAEVVGAVGGAVAGNEIQKHVNNTRHFDVTTRLEGGGTQTISFAAEPPFHVGDKVRVENGTLVPG